MNCRSTSYLIVSCVIWLEIVRPTTAQSANQRCDSTVAGLQRFANGDSAASGIVNLGLSLFGQNPNRVSHAAAADGMQLLARLMEQNGYDRQRAWMAFVQSSEGQRIMCVPGALSLLTDWFNAMMALPSGPGWTINPARTRSQSPSEPPENRAQASNGIGSTPNADLVPPLSGQKVYNASECIGPIIMGVCQGSILPNQAYHPTCYGQMLNGNCTGPMF